MNCPTNKPHSNSSPISSIARVFPLSWFFKSKHKKKNTEFAASLQGRFYSMDEDDYFWRLSFGDETIQARKSTGGINPLRHHFDHREEGRNFNDMVSDIKKMRESRGKQRIVKEKESSNQTSRKFMGFEDEDEKIPSLQERFSNSVSEWLEIEGRKLKELKIKSESSKKKLNKGINKSHSPRIRALEEKKMRKKSRSTTKKKMEQVMEENGIFDSFAVVKSSYNPQKDFRESMMEMIRERGIESAQDLEQLLACYLTLNCDEYHDLIIKVFRQVWFELKNGSCFDHRID